MKAFYFDYSSNRFISSTQWVLGSADMWGSRGLLLSNWFKLYTTPLSDIDRHYHCLQQLQTIDENQTVQLGYRRFVYITVR